MMKGKVKSLVELNPPSRMIFFNGSADQLSEASIDMIAASRPFHITKLESSLDDKISYHVDTLEEGKHYKLIVENKLKKGSYSGFIIIHTDLAEVPTITIRVSGQIEGKISVKPNSIVVGRLGSGQPIKKGKVFIVNNLKQPFEILKMDYDSNLITISQKPLPDEKFGYSLEITPKLENLPKVNEAYPYQRQEVDLVIHTSVDPGEKHEVKVYVIHNR